MSAEGGVDGLPRVGCCPHWAGRHDPDYGSCDHCACVNTTLIEGESTTSTEKARCACGRTFERSLIEPREASCALCGMERELGLPPAPTTPTATDDGAHGEGL